MEQTFLLRPLTGRTSAVGRHISAWSMAFWLVMVVLGQPESENL
jgi:hypothetical protein